MIKKISHFVFPFIVTLWLAGYLVYVTDIFIKRPERNNTETDAIIVLTGGGMRIDTGLDLLSSGFSGQLFITGVHVGVHIDEILASWPEKDKFSECCITLGYKARTTIENAQETKSWALDKDIKSIRLVTSAYHMKRSLLEFENELGFIEIIPHPVPEESNEIYNFDFWLLAFSEYNKFIYRFIVLSYKKYDQKFISLNNI